MLGVEVCSLVTEQGPAYGGAILAMVGAGEYANVSEACAKLVKVKSTTCYDANLVAAYEERYQAFTRLYPALKPVFAKNIK